MNTNNPGREPTDAELRTLHELRECLAVWVSDAMVLGNIRAYDALCAVNAAIAAHRVAKAAFRAMDDAVESDGGARIDKEGWETLCDAMDEYESRMNGFCSSGARPMPDTPAPVLGANQCEHGQLKRQCLTCELQARIADLERENAALGAEVARLDGSTCSAQEQAGDGPCGNCPRCVLENIMAGLGHQIETLNKRVAYLADALLPATGKEPTDAE